MLTMRFSVATAAALLLSGAHFAAAQEPPPAVPPPPAAPEPVPPPPPAATPATVPPPPPPPAPATAVTPSVLYPPPAAAGYRPILPNELPYNDGQPIPPGYHAETRMRKGTVIAGTALFGAGYLIAVGFGVMGAKNCCGFMPMFIPVAGPFITLGTLDYSEQGVGGIGAMVLAPMFVIDGLLQTAGAITFAVGMARPKPVLVLGLPPEATTTPRLRFTGNGIALEGRF
jgi:hypothetical protein